MTTRAWIIAVVLLLAACGSSNKAAAPTSTTSPVAATTSTTIAPMQALLAFTKGVCGGSTFITNGAVESDPLCGVTVKALDDGGFEFTLIAAPRDRGHTFLAEFGKWSGCYTATDIAKMGSTRIGDGRVSSANGRTSWTFQTDTGPTVICAPA